MIEKPDILSDEQVIDWIIANYGKDAIIAPLAHQKEAQRDADVEWYRKVINKMQKRFVDVGEATIQKVLDAEEQKLQQAKVEAAREIIGIYDTYIKLLGEEIDELGGLAYVHGWRSSRFEAGKMCREKIQSLKSKYLEKK